MKYNFIKTSDKETKEKLLKEGFKLVSQDGNVAKFSIAICLHSNHSPTLSGISTKKGGIG